MKAYKENATLGVGKLDYFIASGIKQKNIQDQLYLEDFLKLEDIKPMQTSYTQTAEDRVEDIVNDNSDKEKEDLNSEKVVSENEPSDKTKEVKEGEDSESKSEE